MSFDKIVVEKDGLRFGDTKVEPPFDREKIDAILGAPRVDEWACEFLGKISYVDDVLVLHRLHDGNVTPRRSFPVTKIIQMRADLVWNLILRIRRERRKG